MIGKFGSKGGNGKGQFCARFANRVAAVAVCRGYVLLNSADGTCIPSYENHITGEAPTGYLLSEHLSPLSGGWR